MTKEEGKEAHAYYFKGFKESVLKYSGFELINTKNKQYQKYTPVNKRCIARQIKRFRFHFQKSVRMSLKKGFQGRLCWSCGRNLNQSVVQYRAHVLCVVS